MNTPAARTRHRFSPAIAARVHHRPTYTRLWRVVAMTVVIATLPVSSAQVGAESQPASSQPAVEEQIPDDFGDIELLELEVPVVVSAARHEQRITDVPYAISVITAEDIHRAGALTIYDALRLVPGVDVAELTAGNAAVAPRATHGFVARSTLVLVDGRQIFDSLFGGTLWRSWPFQLEDIERIEVIRGPGGVTWGANAVNGVINIITKDPADQVGLTSISGGGSRGWLMEHLGFAHSDGKLRYRVSGEYEAHDGFLRGGSLVRRLDDEYKNGRVGIHAIYDAGADDTLTFSAGNALLDGGYPAPPSTGIGLYRNSGSQATYFLGRWAHRIADDNRMELTAYVNDFQASNGAPTIDYRYQQFALQFSHVVKINANHTLTWGIDSRADVLDASNADPFMLSKDFIGTAVIGLYVQDQWRFAPNWVLDLGARIDYEFYGGFQPSARVALSRQLTQNSSLYAAVSRAFQMPPPALRFLDIPQMNGLARMVGTRDMDPETLIAYEVGYRARFLDRVDTSATVYWHEYQDTTSLVSGVGPPGLLRVDLKNAGEFSLYGAELEARYAVTPDLVFLGNYTYERMNWRGLGPYYVSDGNAPPKHKFMVGAQYSPISDLHLSSYLYWVDAVQAPNTLTFLTSRRVDPYFRLDLRAEYEFWKDQASFAVGVKNLIDNHHLEGGTLFLNDAEVPRMVYAQLRLHFK